MRPLLLFLERYSLASSISTLIIGVSPWKLLINMGFLPWRGFRYNFRSSQGLDYINHFRLYWGAVFAFLRNLDSETPPQFQLFPLYWLICLCFEGFGDLSVLPFLGPSHVLLLPLAPLHTGANSTELLELSFGLIHLYFSIWGLPRHLLLLQVLSVSFWFCCRTCSILMGTFGKTEKLLLCCSYLTGISSENAFLASTIDHQLAKHVFSRQKVRGKEMSEKGQFKT